MVHRVSPEAVLTAAAMHHPRSELGVMMLQSSNLGGVWGSRRSRNLGPLQGQIWGRGAAGGGSDWLAGGGPNIHGIHDTHDTHDKDQSSAARNSIRPSVPLRS